jgi:DNA-binding MarR family transcriptional regulator
MAEKLLDEQLPLFMRPIPARRKDPETSQISAGKLILSGRLSNQERVVLAALHQYPGSTSGELARTMRADRYLPSCRLPSLRAQGLVRRGETKRRCIVTKMLCIVW